MTSGPCEDFDGGQVDLLGRPMDDLGREILPVADLLGQGEMAIVLEPAVERAGVGEADPVAQDVAGFATAVAIGGRPRLGRLYGLVAVEILTDAEQDTCSLER